VVSFISQNYGQIVHATFVQLKLVLIALLIGLCIAVPLGFSCAKRVRVANIVIRIAGIIMTIPSPAMFGLLIPVLAFTGHGIGAIPAVIALVLYAQLPLIQNIYTGMRSVDPALVQVGVGLGMTERQVARSVKLPVAMPVILGGVRIALVMGVGIAAIAAYIGAGGLGVFIFTGIDQVYPTEIEVGSLALVLLALSLDGILAAVQRRASRKAGIR
jgi:osmoprotectant transport system permease protein